VDTGLSGAVVRRADSAEQRALRQGVVSAAALMERITEAMPRAGDYHGVIIAGPPSSRGALSWHWLLARCALAGVGREAIGERGDEVAQFVGALDDERPVE